MKDYVYDGSFEGLLTTLFYTYKEKDSLCIYKKEDYIPSLIEEVLTIITEEDKADRVYRSLLSKLSFETLTNVYHLYLSDLPQSENLILDYIRLCYQYSATINLAKNNPIIHKVENYTRKVTLEAHRMIGFVRFREIHSGIFYAQIEPDHHILPLIIEHFQKRFSNQYFIIHDLKRELALVYNKQEAYLKDFSPEEKEKLLNFANKDGFEELFKSYYKATTIPERLNERQRRSYMPRRYWKHLFEVSS
ncbi:DNA metabolism protein [Sporanaerobium hydrogeniformans]|uniref:DNA metabolism protein n=1 Tax=Sporanaerobium hydrogeniformans TaxID=3072179 RepID=A0AC61D9V8_9FIRM|nr:TIGR03915 family putative DNA repair protein [Sporanaerobium hydrogeniformans]PHV69518.1 DNA metabolism protein [Sporanaerobium hydrogeniformans]